MGDHQSEYLNQCKNLERVKTAIRFYNLVEL